MTVQQIDAEWTAGDRQSLAAVRLGPEGLGAMLGIQWKRACDDLDCFDYAVLVCASGRVFALRRYCRMPTPGTEIVVGLGLARPDCTLAEALSALGLTAADLTWTRPHDAG